MEKYGYNITEICKKQVLGKRMGLVPYYALVEQTGSRLVLQSSPGANRKPGRVLIALGAALLLLSVLVFILSFLSGGMEDFGAFFMGMVCSWPCGVVGGVVLIGGSAIAKTVNTITVDAEAQTITYSQKARKERKQTLGFGQVAHLRLSQQQFNPSFFLQRMHEVMVLECVTDEQTYWLVDSAADLEALRPTANALTAILGKELVFDKHPGT